MMRLMEETLDAGAAHQAFVTAHGHHGAVSAFTGVVRGDSGAVEGLYLDWYPGMTQASLRAIGEAAQARFDIAAWTILHRCGQVDAGQAAVFTAAAARHRRPAIEAVDYMMDRLKSEAALWKRETGATGSRWVEPRAQDAADLKRWS